MTTLDFGPLFRSTVGFDHLERLLDSVSQWDQSSGGYPPYNIETWEDQGEAHYRVTMAVAGFRENELNIEAHENVLTVVGKKPAENADVQYLHRGIAGRDFIRKFHLADHVAVKSANLDNGLLSIDLVREVPEEMKPRTIAIKPEAPESLARKAKRLIEGEKAA
jgi:molecular chaperone IbpA